jgi:hypothetical protein
MIPVKLIGTPTCRRYQRMKKVLLDAAERTQIFVDLNEIEEIEVLEKFNPLSLPRLYVNDELIASQNPPSVEKIVQFLRDSD